ncbi:homoprotocatechuate degradation operon regulator HpaR [Amorphus sp. 3PC139-8]|uniref:homoprotocatechuate degradation operon regulator HpaR n=1 Tax=Amorphus sp. 3PC139-8 TaxID=2735676 RepID=UPI00345D1E67
MTETDDLQAPAQTDAARSASVTVKLRSFSRSLPMTLLLAREAVMNRFRSSLHLFNLTEQQWRVLRALNAVREIEVTDLANATSLLAPSLSRILRDLEGRGLIRRRPDPADLRRALISISDDGLKVIAAVAPYSEEIYAEVEAAFGAERMETLQALLKELTETVNQLPDRSYRADDLSDDLRDIVGLRRARSR